LAVPEGWLAAGALSSGALRPGQVAHGGGRLSFLQDMDLSAARALVVAASRFDAASRACGRVSRARGVAVLQRESATARGGVAPRMLGAATSHRDRASRVCRAAPVHPARAAARVAVNPLRQDEIGSRTLFVMAAVDAAVRVLDLAAPTRACAGARRDCAAPTRLAARPMRSSAAGHRLRAARRSVKITVNSPLQRLAHPMRSTLSVRPPVGRPPGQWHHRPRAAPDHRPAEG
jgi:hypothetical protein